MATPIDPNTGQQSGPELPGGTVDVLVGYLVIHADGFEARLGPDKTRADLYAIRNHATVEAMYVRRKLPTHPAPPTS